MIFVRKAILSAAEQLTLLSDSSGDADPLDLAELKIDECRAVGDDPGVKFWRSVWIHLICTWHAPGKIQTHEDGEVEAKRRSVAEITH